MHQARNEKQKKKNKKKQKMSFASGRDRTYNLLLRRQARFHCATLAFTNFLVANVIDNMVVGNDFSKQNHPATAGATFQAGSK